MTANRVLRAGLIGLGRMGRHHARILRQLDHVTLAAAADPAGDPYRAADGIPVLPAWTTCSPPASTTPSWPAPRACTRR